MSEAHYMYTDLSEVTLREKEYTQYIKNHIENVQKAYNELSERIQVIDDEWLIEEFKKHEGSITEQVLIHDRSKFLPVEYYGYRVYFYPTEVEKSYKEKMKSWFLKSWLHHIHNNKHHWEHWIIPGEEQKVIPMPFEYIIEMYLDWQAMSYVFNNTPDDFYERKKDEILLHDETIETLKKLIYYFG